MVSIGKVRANDRLPLARATSVHCLSEASCITHKVRHGQFAFTTVESGIYLAFYQQQI